jgi:hypothetical protein
MRRSFGTRHWAVTVVRAIRLFLPSFVCVVFVSPALAIPIEAGINTAMPSPNEVGIMGIRPLQSIEFSVTINGGGEVILNNTGGTIRDLHFFLGPNDMWADTAADADMKVGSSNIFGTIRSSANARALWFEGGSIPNNQRFRTQFTGNAADNGKIVTVRAHYTVAEPATLLLFGTGLAGLAITAWRRHGK